MNTNKRFYELGKKSQNSRNLNAAIDANWDDLKNADTIAMLYFETGWRGAEMPYPVTGWRYGHIPDRGQSWNYADNRYESGVSVMALDNGDSTTDTISALFFADRPIVRVSGLLNTIKRGSDGEPLIIYAQEIK